MNLKRSFAIASVIAATFAGAAAVVAQNFGATRDQLHHVDLWSRDLVPAMAAQMQNPGTASYGYANRDAANQMRALMAVGRFSGEARAFHEAWDRFPDAPMRGPMADLDSSFRIADQAIQQANVSRDVSRRWSTIRDAYFHLQDGVSGVQNGRPYVNGGYDNEDRGSVYGHSDRPQIIIQQGRH